MVYRVEATHNEYDHILADHRETKDARGDRRAIGGPQIGSGGDTHLSVARRDEGWCACSLRRF
jgi:hypothetical protein